MNDSRTYYLLSRYVSNTIRREEWEELKRIVAAIDDRTLLFMLERLWDESGNRHDALPARQELDTIIAGIRKTYRLQSLKIVLSRTLKIAGIFLILLLLGISAYLYRDRQQMTILGRNEVIVSAAKGQKAMVTLPDGSTAYLNSESSLRYQQNYGYENRKVRLEGEAFFEVKKDSANVFTVCTEYLDIDVLGTCFNVYAYETENIVEMTLVSGDVKIGTHATPSRTIYVKPNEKAVYDKASGKLHLERTNIRFNTAWTRGELAFRSERIATVLSRVERRYGVKIHIEGNGLNDDDRFTGCFDSDQIADVIEILATHYGFRYKIKGEEVRIYTANKSVTR
jgi:ferric-dicitrate binding protein FerR (iron transport regulator)